MSLHPIGGQSTHYPPKATTNGSSSCILGELISGFHDLNFAPPVDDPEEDIFLQSPFKPPPQCTAYILTTYVNSLYQSTIMMTAIFNSDDTKCIDKDSTIVLMSHCTEQVKFCLGRQRCRVGHLLG